MIQERKNLREGVFCKVVKNDHAPQSERPSATYTYNRHSVDCEAYLHGETQFGACGENTNSATDQDTR